MSTNKWMTLLTKDFGEVASAIAEKPEKVITMPSPSLNWAVGNNGLVAGKAICLYGPESSGKSLLMQLILAQIQKDDPEAICVLFDAEMSFRPQWFAKLGGDLDRLIVRRTNDPVMIFDWMIHDLLQMLQDGAPVRGIGLDSVRSICFPADQKKVTTDLTMGGSGAKYLTSALKRITPIIREFDITTIMVQQVYEEMDANRKMSNPWIIPDGRALKHFCDYMLQVDKVETKAGRIEAGDTMTGAKAQVGHRVRVKCRKNRTAAPARVAEFSLEYTRGIVDTSNELVNLAISLGVIYHPENPDTGRTNNQMWKFANHDPVRGEENLRKWVASTPNLFEPMVKACNLVADSSVIDARNQTLDVLDVSIDNEELQFD